MTPYNRFMRSELARIKSENPNISHREAFQMAAKNWKLSDHNPKHKEQDNTTTVNDALDEKKRLDSTENKELKSNQNVDTSNSTTAKDDDANTSPKNV
jgi:hypothetical protein